MTGTNIGGVAILPNIQPVLPMLSADDIVGKWVIWEIGNTAAPVRVVSTEHSWSGNEIADPQASPDVDTNGVPAEFVFSIVGSSGGVVNSVQRVAWDDSSNVQIASAPNANDNGLSISLQPSFSPDGTKVLYRDTSFDSLNPTVSMKIKVVNRDGTGDTVLYDPADNAYKLSYPVFSADGNYIAFTSTQSYNPTPITVAQKYRIHVMEDDGSNHTVIVGPLSGAATDTIPLLFDTVSWKNAANTLAYLKPTSGSSYTADWEWHSINFDGTGDTTLYTIDRAAYTFPDTDPGPIYSSWKADDSAVITALLDTGTGLHELSELAGGVATGLGVFVDWGTGGTEMCRPLVYEGRVYYPVGINNDQTIVKSVTEAGAGERTEFDGTIYDPGDNVIFQGFRGTVI